MSHRVRSKWFLLSAFALAVLAPAKSFAESDLVVNLSPPSGRHCSGTIVKGKNGESQIISAAHCFAKGREVAQMSLGKTAVYVTCYPHTKWKTGGNPGTGKDSPPNITVCKFNKKPPIELKGACLESQAPKVGDKLEVIGVTGPNGKTKQNKLEVGKMDEGEIRGQSSSTPAGSALLKTDGSTTRLVGIQSGPTTFTDITFPSIQSFLSGHGVEVCSATRPGPGAGLPKPSVGPVPSRKPLLGLNHKCGPNKKCPGGTLEGDGDSESAELKPHVPSPRRGALGGKKTH